MPDQCIVCAEDVRPRQHGIMCDSCQLWQHRTCGTGISIHQYRTAVQNGDDIPFTCARCQRRNPITDEHGATFVVQTSLLSDNTTEMEDTENTTEMDYTENNNALVTSFNVDGTIVQEPETQEDNIQPEPLSTTIIEETEIEFEVFDEGTKKGKPLLVGSDGFRYFVKKKLQKSVLWSCSKSSAKCRCYASVVQKGNVFSRGPNRHTHQPEPALANKVRISMQVKQEARDQPYKSSTVIGVEARRKYMASNQPAIPVANSLARKANRAREKLRPPPPTDLNFEVNMDFLKCPEFLVADVFVGTARHMVFATQEQLDLLSSCKRWFLDATFKVMGDPFASGQLESIHGFINSDGVEKQLPMVFILMSRRRTEDYVKVFTAVRDALVQINVENFVMDYEQAMWLAVRQVFPGTTIKGCIFHFQQAVWKKIQDLGLRPVYMQRATVYHYIRQVMMLPFLPATHIEPAFEELAPRANTEQLRGLVSYMDRQWMNHPIFNIPSWSVFGLSIRTNNDVEGWHHRLNNMTGHQSLTFYRLVPVLRREAEDVHYELRHLREGTSTRRVRASVLARDARLQDLWQQYRDKAIETGTLLAECAKYFGPVCDSVGPSQPVVQITRL